MPRNPELRHFEDVILHPEDEEVQIALRNYNAAKEDLERRRMEILDYLDSLEPKRKVRNDVNV